MCGIFGYCGEENAGEKIKEGLARLEYRGYDSVGLALEGEKEFFLCKRLGGVSEIAKERVPFACTGIGHTRWATHGEPSERNAHPHLSSDGEIALVHNGIVENYRSLAERLSRLGYRFRSETDSEVIADLIASFDPSDLLKAVYAATKELVGSYAIAVMGRKTPHTVVLASNGSPLVVGRGTRENFAASDSYALEGEAKEAARLPKGAYAVLTPSEVRFYDGELNEISPSFFPVEAPEHSARESYMAAEISEGVDALFRTVTYYRAHREELREGARRIRCAPLVRLIGCGTAFHAALAGVKYFRHRLNIYSECEIASVYRDTPPLIREGEVAIFISQSGETADTLGALELAKKRGAFTIALTNTPYSALADCADLTLKTLCGTEIAVASTKTFDAQLVLLLLLAYESAGILSSRTFDRIEEGVCKAVQANDSAAVLDAAQRFASSKNFFFLGRGLDEPIAMEGALKLKEITYLSCQAYPAGELKHGSLALVEQGSTVIALMCDPATAPKTALALAEVRSRGANVLLLTTDSLSPLAPADSKIILPSAEPEIVSLYAPIPLQWFAYHCATILSRNPDRPRNLAKSVTVE